MTGVVVVGVDDSPTARKAAHTAARLAQALGASLHVVTAFGSERGETVGSGSDRMVVSEASKAKDVAEKVAAELGQAPLEVIPFAIHGSPPQALVKQAETHNARLIVVGSKGMRGLGRVLGSIATGVAHNAPCDVYVVKTDDV
ncbi:universal stress protein UspA [Arthrobacter sp. SW1]|uniref:universal stress protein n=1 Tax=Arthrobacter sp. SW1 TaxID=1920889 RepID=UPI000877C55D|nr:universal stress protein [Arthrobacter sp. SW1]OFI39522.1 universal stress protein UspA [Arthrobacter sp. SW1]